MRLFLLIFCISLNTIIIKGQKTSLLPLKGLLAKAEVLRDKWGVNHIYAGNQHDLFFLQGYCAAKDRLFQFELWRRQATGTLAEILGPQEIKRDIGARLFKYRGNMDEELQHYHRQGKAIILAFTEGINEYIDETLKHPNQLPPEFKLLNIKPGKWSPEVVISRHQGIIGNVTEELNIGRAVSKAGADEVKHIMWFHPKDPSLKIDSSINTALLFNNILELYKEYKKDVRFKADDIDSTIADINYHADNYGDENYLRPSPEGSNNWIISGSRTANGAAILANDPHRKISVPSLRYIVHLNAPGWNVIGGGEPEIPGVSIGHNDYGAWGVTISETDGEDLYVYQLNPKQPDVYYYKGSWVKMTQLKETIVVKNQEPVNVLLHYTIHGPVVYIDSINHVAYAIRTVALNKGSAPYLSALRLDQAKNWSGFRDACSYSNLPALNMVWADKQGNIGWQVVGASPQRENFSGLVPVPGDGRYEWNGILPIKEKPHIFNPKQGFFVTANQSLTPDDYKHWDANGFTWPDAFRADRLNKELFQNNKVTIKDVKDYQTNYYSVPASELVPMLRPIIFNNALLTAAKDSLMRWNYVLDKNSVAASIYAMWEFTMMHEAGKRFIPQSIKGLVYIQTTKLITWLQAPDSMFGKDSITGRNEFLKQTFEMTIDSLNRKLGDSINNWLYGQERFKHIKFIHPLSEFLNEDWNKKLNTESLPRGGYGHSVCSTGDEDNQSSGASFRMITETDNWDNTLMINAPGQSGNPLSPYYKNLFELWANDSYFTAYFSKAKIKTVTTEALLFLPEKK